MSNMWRSGSLVLAAMAISAQLMASEGPATVNTQACTKVLFVGNSLTYENSLPSLFKAYIERVYPGESVCTGMIAKPGATLAAHRRDGEAARRIADEGWDYVVLQEGRDVAPGGTLNGKKWYAYPDTFLDSVAYFTQVARASGAKPVLLETWANDQKATQYVRHAFLLAQSITDALVAPVGDVWRGMSGTRGLLQEDGIHPSVRGSTLTAITLAQTMLDSPAISDSAEIGGLSAAEVEAVRRLAAGGFSATGMNYSIEYDPVPVIHPVDKLNLQAGEHWRARFPSLRYSLGAILEVGDGAQSLKLVTFAPSGRIILPLESLRKDERKLQFETTSGGVRYSVQVVRDGQSLRALTSYKSDETHRNFATAEFSLTEDDAYFDALADLYSVLDASEKEIGLSGALRNHYSRLKALVGAEGMSRALAGFELDEWDCIMLGWQYQEAGDSRRALEYLRAASEIFPKSVDAALNLADAYNQIGNNSEALKVLGTALRNHAHDQRAQQRIKKKIRTLSTRHM